MSFDTASASLSHMRKPGSSNHSASARALSSVSARPAGDELPAEAFLPAMALNEGTDEPGPAADHGGEAYPLVVQRAPARPQAQPLKPPHAPDVALRVPVVAGVQATT